jgi:hypothetical protein
MKTEFSIADGILIFTVSLLFTLTNNSWAAPPPSLFAPAKQAADGMPTPPPDKTVIRSRLVNINLGLLSKSSAAQPDKAATAPQITLNLFDNKSLVADNIKIENTRQGIIWTGKLQNDPLSQVIMVITGDIVAGNISSPAGTYQIRPVANGIHSIQEIDTSKYPDDEMYLPLPPNDQMSKATAPDTSAQMDSGAVVDVMVAYTATARAAAGSTANMQSLIALAVAESNTAYDTSNAGFHLNLVHSVEVAYTETGDMGTDLTRVSNPGDGYLDQVATLRDTYKADLVSFWVENGGNYCGLAWLMDPVSSSFAPNGFSVVARNCATGYYSFGHEIGHNMGLRHDAYVDPNTTPYTYAHGYTNPAAGWRSIMAYNNACSAVGKNCTRLQFFSNPDLSGNGIPLGDAATADNHRVLTNTAYTVANFRQSSTPKNLLKIIKAGTGTGTVTSSPAGISCGADCSQRYNSGTSVTLTATPAAGSAFTRWVGCTSTNNTTYAVCNFSLPLQASTQSQT